MVLKVVTWFTYDVAPTLSGLLGFVKTNTLTQGSSLSGLSQQLSIQKGVRSNRESRKHFAATSCGPFLKYGYGSTVVV